MKKKRHSESVLSDLREGWWSYDYLELIAQRLGLSKHETILDVGCGHGHWGLLLMPLFAPSATLVGGDQEIDWVARASERSLELGLKERCHFEQADAHELPYDDKSFDLVTCQTLLMHLARPETAIREMLRVLKPGGRLLLAEPNNLANQFSGSTVQRSLSPLDFSNLAQLLMACSRGRNALGRGDDAIADVLPTMLLAQGVEDVRVFQNEKPSQITPPYSDVVRAQLDEESGHAKSGFWLWDRDDAERLFAAGGGESGQFDEAYRVFLMQSQTFAEQVGAKSYARTGGGHHYLITGLAHCP